MMKLPQLMLGSAVLVLANFASAQTAATSTTVTADVPVGTVSAGANTVLPTTPMAPATTSQGGTMSGDAGVAAGTTAGSMPATTAGGTVVAPSTDPYVQKREVDAAAKADYRDKKSVAKEEYKEEKAQAKSTMKAERRQAARDRKAALATVKKPAMPDTIN